MLCYYQFVSLDCLSPREWQVAEARARGVPHKTIAANLKLSPWTVRTYAGRVFDKLGVRSSYELAPIVLLSSSRRRRLVVS